VAGGADLLACYGTAAYRILGVPTALAFLPYDDANELTLDLLPTVVGQARGVPVIAGLGAHDPRRPIASLVEAAVGAGALGVTNEPFSAIYGPALRAELDEAGVGFLREVELLVEARRRGLLTLGWAFDAAEASALVEAGVDVLGAMAGITGGRGEVAEALSRLRAIVDEARRMGRGTIVLLHGGPLVDPPSVELALRATGADGYVTGSSAERGPVAAAVRDAVAAFRQLRPGSGQ
jgi:predicted TIM-barrel enzyme